VFEGEGRCGEFRSAEVLRDGWYHTGDLGYMDEDGYCYIVDRKKDMIIAGGYNIYPREIDEILFQHPKILEACSIGVPDAYRGETVKAYVVVKPGETLIVDNFHLVGFSDTCSYKVTKFGGLKETLLGGEGLVTQITGPGEIYIQTKNVKEFVDWIWRYIIFCRIS
jgi:acyl-CoA synthetase (AMP-forming)/AMP-acid ligase II